MIMNQADIEKLLPHREPLLLIHEVSELISGSSLTAITHIDPDWELFKGHFPGHPILPGIYIIECMAQACSLLLLENHSGEEKLPLLFQVRKMRFLHSVAPDDVLITSAVLNLSCGNDLYDFDVTATIDGKKVASGVLTIILK